MDIRHVLATSSGTLASLTGLREYGKIDVVYQAWVQHELDHPTDTHDWRIAWRAFEMTEQYEELRDRLS